MAFSKTNVEISYPDKVKGPLDRMVREAFGKQTGRTVHVGFGIIQPPDDSADGNAAGGNAAEVLKRVKATAESADRTISEIQKSKDGDDNLRKLVEDIIKSLASLQKAFTAADTFVNVKKSEVDNLARVFQNTKPKTLSLEDDPKILKRCEEFVAMANKIEMPK